VHKNLGECLLQEGNIQEAQDELLTAAEMDGGDITLWFKIAGGDNFTSYSPIFKLTFFKKNKRKNK